MNKYLEKIAMGPAMKRVAVQALGKLQGASKPQLSSFIQRAKEGKGLSNLVTGMKKPITSLNNPELVKGIAQHHSDKVSNNVMGLKNTADTVLKAHGRAQTSGLGTAHNQLHAEAVAARYARMKSKLDTV